MMEGAPVPGRLLFLTPRVGDLSETFVRDHINHLAPGATTVVTRQIVNPLSGNTPVHVVDRRRGRKRWRDEIARRFPKVRDLRDSDWQPSAGARKQFDAALSTKPDAVFVEYLDQFSRFAERAADAGVPVLMQAHGYDISSRLRDRYWQERYRQLSEHPGIRFVVNSQHVLRVLESLGVSGDNVRLVHNAVPDLAHVVPHGGRRAERGGLHMVALGRLVPKKDLRPVLQAMQRVHRFGLKIELKVVGGGPLRGEYERTAAALGIDALVKFVGPVRHDDALRHLADADVFVQHSATDPETGDTEGLPIAILEAMSMSKPVVSTLHAGIPEAVISGESGLLGAEHDVDALEDAIVRLCSEPHTLAAMGEAARTRWSSMFTQDRQINDLRTLLFARPPLCP